MHEIEAPEERSQVSGTLIGALEGIRNGTKTEIGKNKNKNTVHRRPGRLWRSLMLPRDCPKHPRYYLLQVPPTLYHAPRLILSIASRTLRGVMNVQFQYPMFLDHGKSREFSRCSLLWCGILGTTSEVRPSRGGVPQKISIRMAVCRPRLGSGRNNEAVIVYSGDI